jgi:lipopolysaccharide export system permease protein
MHRLLTIIDRYVARELWLTWLAVTLVLMLILLSSTLARLLGKAADGSIPSDVVFPLLLVTGARYLILLVPLSLYLGILLTFSRLYKDNEMAALGACGIGTRRLYRPLLLVAMPVSVMMMMLTLWLMPLVAQQGQVIKAGVESRSELSGMAAGRFNEARDGKAIMFLERQSEDGHYMENVFLHRSSEQGDRIETADRARRYQDTEGRQFIMFENGEFYQGEPGQRDYTITRYSKHGIYIAEAELVQNITRNDAMSTVALWASDKPYHRAELQWRLSIPVACLLLAILALPLSYTTPRKGRYSKLALAILIYLIYSNLLGVGQTWVERQLVPNWLGIWWVHGFALLLIVGWWITRAGGLSQLFIKPVPSPQT